MADRSMTIDDTEKLLLGLNRAGLIDAKVGAPEAWHDALADLPVTAVWDAMRHFNREGVPGGRLFLRASDIRQWVLARARATGVPRHLQCEVDGHGDQYAYRCGKCPKAIERAAPDVMARVRQLAEQAQIDGKARDAERAAALQRRADESAERVRLKLEKQRQLDAYNAQEAPR